MFTKSIVSSLSALLGLSLAFRLALIVLRPMPPLGLGGGGGGGAGEGMRRLTTGAADTTWKSAAVEEMEEGDSYPEEEGPLADMIP